MILAQVEGTGSYLPGPAISNDRLVGLLGRGIRRWCDALGVRQRHWAVDPDNGWKRTDLRNSEMAARAAREALHNAGLTASEVDLLLLVTATPDYPFPATVTIVQELLGIPECIALELRGACAGITQALATADLFIRSGRASVAILIGTEMSSALIDFTSARTESGGYGWSDDVLLSALMFGDGAGAVVMVGRQVADEREGLFATLTRSVGPGQEPGFLCRFGGSKQPFLSVAESAEGNYLVHDFKAVRDLGPKLVLRGLADLTASTGLGPDDFQLIVPPQANPMLTSRSVVTEGLDPTRVFSNVDRAGNTSSASLLVALDEVNRTGRVEPGDRVALLGAEASKWLYGAAALTWTRNGSGRVGQDRVGVSRATKRQADGGRART